MGINGKGGLCGAGPTKQVARGDNSKPEPEAASCSAKKALAKMFRSKLLDGLRKAGLILPRDLPKEWVVHCKSVGNGSRALAYLGRYLYRGVIQE